MAAVAEPSTASNTQPQSSAPPSLCAFWQKFFADVGCIPPSVCVKYVKLMNVNRIQESMLPDLDKAVLNEVGINAVGDVIAIIKHARRVVAARDTQEFINASRPGPGPVKQQQQQQQRKATPVAQGVSSTSPTKSAVPKQTAAATTTTTTVVTPKAANSQKTVKKSASAVKVVDNRPPPPASVSPDTAAKRQRITGPQPAPQKIPVVTSDAGAAPRHIKPPPPTKESIACAADSTTTPGSVSQRDSVFQRLGRSFIKKESPPSHHAGKTKKPIAITTTNGGGSRVHNRLGKHKLAAADSSAVHQQSQPHTSSALTTVTIDTSQPPPYLPGPVQTIEVPLPASAYPYNYNVVSAPPTPTSTVYFAPPTTYYNTPPVVQWMQQQPMAQPQQQQTVSPPLPAANPPQQQQPSAVTVSVHQRLDRSQRTGNVFARLGRRSL